MNNGLIEIPVTTNCTSMEIKTIPVTEPGENVNPFSSIKIPSQFIQHSGNYHANTVYIIKTPNVIRQNFNGRMIRPVKPSLFQANTIYRPTHIVQLRPNLPGPITFRSPQKIVNPRPPQVIRVIQPVNASTQMLRTSPPKLPIHSTKKDSQMTTKNYPGDAKEIFDATSENSARCRFLNWKKYQSECKAPDKEQKIKVLKPWDPVYQTNTTKQKYVRQSQTLSLNSNMGNDGAKMEKGLLSDFKKKRRNQKELNGIKKKKIKKEYVDDDEEIENESIRLFKPRSVRHDYNLTLTKDLNTEDRGYLQFALKSILNSEEENTEIDIGNKKVKQVADIYDSIIIDATLDIPNLDNKTKNMDFKTSVSYSIRQFASLPKVKQFRKPKLTEDGKRIYFDDPEIEDIVPNPTGCARTEPYKKKELFKSIKGGNSIGGRQFTVITEEDERQIKTAQERDKQNRQMTRHMLTQISYEHPDLAKLDVFKPTTANFGAKQVKYAKSPIHGQGLFALEDIEADQMVIEYVGEKIRYEIANVREKRYEKEGIGSSYMFRLDNEWVIDATKKGNLARFINHCCQPNCYARIMSRGGIKRIFIFSKYFIEKGQELTYDYKFPLEENKIECHCSAKLCRNFLN